MMTIVRRMKYHMVFPGCSREFLGEGVEGFIMMDSGPGQKGSEVISIFSFFS